MMKQESRLRQIANEVTPHLESGLDITAAEGFRKPAPEMQLRASHCGIATAALQGYLREAHDIDTERLIATADLQVPGVGGGRERHVMLRTPDGVYIDPTHGQFLSHIGLTWQVAETHHKTELFPDPKIMVTSDLGKFATAYAVRVHMLDEANAVADNERGIELRTTGKLRNTALALKQGFYNRLWSPDSMEPFPIEEQPEHMRKHARRIIDHMMSKKASASRTDNAQ